MIGLSLSNLRVRLLLLVLVAILPAFGLIVNSTIEQRRLAAMHAHTNALRLARIASESHKNLIDDGGQLLIVLAKLPEVRGGDPAACRALFADLLKRFPRYTNAVAARPNGDVFCSGLPLPGAVNFFDRPYFRQTLETLDFTVSEYLTGRISGKPLVTLSYPSVDASGVVRAVVSLGLGLDWLDELATQWQLPPRSAMSIIDHTGTILTRLPASAALVGKTVPEALSIRAVLRRAGEGTVQAAGVDGIERLYAFTPLRGPGPLGKLYVSVGIPTDVAFAEVYRSLRWTLVGLGLVTGLMVVAAWVASDLLILGRVRPLTTAAKRLAAGDLGARAKLGAGRDELGALATTFDAMAESLEIRTTELSRSERRFANILDTAADAIISIDADQQIIRYNRGAEKIFGYRANEVMGQSLNMLLPAHLTEVHRQHIRDFATTPETARQMGERKEVSGRRKNGTEFPAEASISKVVHEGEMTFTVVLRDITERRRADEALRESEERFRSAFEASAVGMALQEFDGRYLRVNRALCEMLGYSEPELLARTFHATTHPEDRDADVDFDRRMLAREMSSYQREKRYVHKLGHVVWVLMNVSLVHARDGSPVYFLVQSQDITHRKQAEETLRQTEKLAEMGSLLAGVAHELNNPLMVVTGRAALLSRAVGAGPAAKQAERILEAADRCARIVKNFLALARQHPPERQQVQLNQVVSEAVELLAYPLRVDSVEVALDLADDLPPLWADPHQLHQVLVNLITNAHQAMRGTPSPRRLTLTTRADPSRSHVSLEVADTGPGIPLEIQARIFEPFFTTKPPGQGTGLGLALCHGILQGHGGSMTVDSRPGDGARFHIELPIDRRSVAAPGAEPREEPPRIRGKAILVVDDEPEVVGLLAEMLAADGHRVDTASNGAVALHKLRERAYDLILSDIRMPELDGAGLYRELERAYPHLLPRLVFFTGDMLSPEAQEVLEKVGVRRLHKPFTADEVRQLVRKLLQGS